MIDPETQIKIENSKTKYLKEIIDASRSKHLIQLDDQAIEIFMSVRTELKKRKEYNY